MCHVRLIYLFYCHEIYVACLFVPCLLVEDDPYFWTDDRQSIFPLRQ